MDNSLPGPAACARFGPDRRLTAALGAAGLGACYAAWSTPLAPGQLLLALAAVVLTGYAATDLIFTPRLSATPDGIVVNSPLARARLGWADIDTIRADSHSRHGIRTTTLEIDAGDRLIVLSRRALGAAPDSVAELIRAFDPRHGPQPT